MGKQKRTVWAYSSQGVLDEKTSEAIAMACLHQLRSKPRQHLTDQDINELLVMEEVESMKDPRFWHVNSCYNCLRRYWKTNSLNQAMKKKSQITGVEVKPENYGSQGLIEIWDGLVNWEKRREGENGFLVRQLQAHDVCYIFDACLGDGCDSIYLIRQGFHVTSNEIDVSFMAKAFENANQADVLLRVTALDWCELDTKIPEGYFDSVTCLGNSFTYLFTEESRLRALKQFKRILKDDGILIVDERNYQYMLDNRQAILDGNFQYSGQYVYCGDRVHGRPIVITDQEVKMEYTDSMTGEKYYLTFYPFKRGELKNLLEKAGFKSVSQFSDYQAGENPYADFHQYVAQK